MARSQEQVQLEIAAERQRLADAVDELRTDVRSRLPMLVGGLIAASVLLRGKVPRKALKLLWKLR